MKVLMRTLPLSTNSSKQWCYKKRLSTFWRNSQTILAIGKDQKASQTRGCNSQLRMSTHLNKTWTLWLAIQSIPKHQILREVYTPNDSQTIKRLKIVLWLGCTALRKSRLGSASLLKKVNSFSKMLANTCSMRYRPLTNPKIRTSVTKKSSSASSIVW